MILAPSQERQHTAKERVKEKRYWNALLSEYVSFSQFPVDNYESDNEKSAVHNFSLSTQTTSQLHQLTKGSDQGLHLYLLSAIAFLQSRYSNHSHVICGTPIYKQQKQNLINSFLMLSNTLDGEIVYLDLLKSIKSNLVEAIKHQNYPLDLLLDEEAPNKGVDVMLTLSNIQDPGYTNHIKPQLHFVFNKTAEAITGQIIYNSESYELRTINQLASQVDLFFSQALHNKEIPLSEISLHRPEEKEDIVQLINGNYQEQKSNQTIHGLFEQQVAASPDSIAITHKEEQVTYKALDDRAESIKNTLLEKGLKKGELVAIYLDHSPEAISAILGILKSGGAYLPLSLEFPKDRIQSILEDSQAQLLISNSSLLTSFKTDIAILNVDALRPDQKPQNPCVDVSPFDLAYVIYTSGTTGKPKGVRIEHRNVVSLFTNTDLDFSFGPKDTWCLFHSLGFDFSVWELFGALLNGSRLVLTTLSVTKDPDLFSELINKESVTVLNQTPSAFYNLQRTLEKNSIKLKELRYVIFGGEALSPARLKKWHSENPEVRLINMYGITEITIHATFKEITSSEILNNLNNIGRPITSLKIHVLDQNMKHQPIGVPGEMWIEGAGVSSGYLNNEALTEDRFKYDVLGEKDRLYKTGDIARVLANGELTYISRNDRQVQLKGYRIETEEIEQTLLLHHQITDALVMVRENAHQESILYGYLIKQPGEKLDREAIRAFLLEKLPQYMVPSLLILLDEFPLTTNGKLDKSVLPLESEGEENTFIEERNYLEVCLADIWQRIIGLDSIHIDDSFFNLGGDSIVAIRLTYAINKELDCEIRIQDLYENPSIRKIALLVKQGSNHYQKRFAKVEGDLEVRKPDFLSRLSEPDNVKDLYPMTDIQVGMVYHYNRGISTGVYHDQFIFESSYVNFDLETFDKALGAMVDKHEILRTGFNLTDFDIPIQVVRQSVKQDLEYKDYVGLNKEELEAIISKDLAKDLTNRFEEGNAPLWRLTVYNTGNNKQVFLFVCHHAILDGWSMQSLITELNNTYVKLANGQNFSLPSLGVTNRDASIDEIMEKNNPEHVEFWKEQLTGYNRLTLPEITSSDVGEPMQVYRHPLPNELLSTLNKLSASQGTPISYLMFSAYCYVVSLFSGQKDLVVGYVTNTRPELEDADKLLGCFLNTIPVRIEVNTELTWSTFVEYVTDIMIKVKKHERLSLFEIYRNIPELSNDQNPLFDTLFNYIHFHILDELVDPSGGKLQNENLSPSRDHLSVSPNTSTNTLFDFEISRSGNSVTLLPKYNVSRIPVSFVEKFCQYFHEALIKMTSHAEGSLKEHHVMPKEERNLVINQFNDTSKKFENDMLIDEMIGRKFVEQPDTIAIIKDGEKVSYAHLRAQTELVAEEIAKAQVPVGHVVAVFMENTTQMVSSTIGIIKSGCIYLPVDPGTPDERVVTILKSAKVRHLICSDTTVERAKKLKEDGSDIEAIFLHDQGASMVPVLNEKSKVAPSEGRTKVASSDPAYVIYTSGSSGVPKGVLVSHRSAVNLFEWMTAQFHVSKGDKLIFTNSISFDLSIYDILGTLAAGATIYLMENGATKDPEKLIEIIEREQITIWDSAPAAMQLLTQYLVSTKTRTPMPSLRLCLLSGDWIPLNMAPQLKNYFPEINVIGLGGATEATVWSNYFPIGEIAPGWSSIPYGKPIQNAQYYILDEDLNPSPIGVPGDLFISGDCVSMGYLNEPSLTVNSYIKHPGMDNKTLYKTGDTAKWWSDGNMEFLGRKDEQVKIRGYRVEIGEIYAQMIKHPQLIDVVIMAKGERTNKFLVTYFTAEEHVSTNVLKEFLSDKLPEYMIPAFFTKLEQIPVNKNGKVDYKALKAITVTQDDPVEKPANELEEKIAQLCAEVIDIEYAKIDMGSSFFGLGGNSLNVIQFLNRIREELQAEIALREFFTFASLKELAKKIELKEWILKEPTTEGQEMII